MKLEARGFFQDFRDFAMKGNVIDLAIGVIIGAAFGKVVSSLVADIVMPVLGIVLGFVDLKNLKLSLGRVPGTSNDVVLTYGAFLQNVLDFLIVALALFFIIKVVSRVRRRFERKQKTGEAPKPADIVLLEEIRDLLRKDHV